MEKLYSDPYYEVTQEGGLVRLTRTAAHFPDIKAVETTMENSAAALRKVASRETSLLVDLRKGPMRNDPEFEAVTARYRFKFAEGFANTAVLVRTAVGKLQMTRLSRESGRDIPLFDDENAAIAALRAG